MLTYPTLQCLKQYRLDAALTPSLIESISAARRAREGAAAAHLETARYRLIENQPQHEPTYAEALALAHILLLPGIAPLINRSGEIYSMVGMLGPLRDDDIANFIATRDVPLSVALRVAIALGLDDPIELEHMPIHSQIWSTIEQNERLAAPGECPWCRGAAGAHLPTCLPAVLFAPWSSRPYLTTTLPRTGAPKARGSGRYGTGLKVARARTTYTQKQVADACRLHVNTYSRIERCEEKLTNDNAEKIAVLLKCSKEMLFT